MKDGLVYSGYMISSYVSFSSEYYESSSTAVVDIENLNIRQGAGTGNTILVTIPRNTQVQVLDAVTTSNGQYWDLVYLTYGGTKYIGYALAEYVYTGYDGVTYDRNVMDTLDSNVFHMTGNPSQKKKLTQTINISGKANDTYMANVWATGYPVTEKNERKYGLEVEFVSTDGTTESYISTFGAMTLDWQFLNDVFIAKKDYTKINVSCIFYYNCNAVAFDGLALYREDFAQSYMYDSEGNVTSVADNAKKQSSFEYDSNNNLTKMTDPKGNNFTYTYDSSHNVTAAVSAANVKYTFQYDSYGNPTETKVENPSDSSQYIRSTAGYTSNGNYQTSVTDALGNTSKSTYNETKGLLTKSTDADGNATNYTYDSMGRLTGVSAAVSEGITDGTAQVTYAYEDDSLKSITHNGYQYVFEEDGFGNSTGVYVAGAKLVERTYEGNNGNLSTEVYANGYTYLYSYDEFDRVIQIDLKNSSGTEYVLYRYEYDKEGNLAVEYDVREDIGKGTIVTRYFYDLSGRLVYTSTDSEESYRYVYDLNDNLTKIVQKNPYGTLKAEYTYDKDSRETSTKITYEAENSDSSTTDDSGKTYSTVYDALGRVTSQSWDTENAITTQYTYQAGKNGSQSSQVKKLTNGAGETSYTYDANGNITSLVSESETAAYAYDELNQLIREDSSERSQTITYVYDLGGNLKEKRIYSYQPSATDEELAQSEPTDTIVYGYDATWKDKLVSYDDQDITYDALGNPLSYRGMTMTWSKARELYSLKKSGITYRYRYDSDGMRTNKFLSNGTVTYQIEGNLIVGEQKVDSTGALVYELEFLYDSSGNVLGMVYNGEEYYYEKNLQGDIVGLMDGTGTRIATYKYDSWGKTLRIFGSNAELGKINPFRYRSYYYDRETGLFYLNSRYYDPEVGRFISADNEDVLTENHQSFIQNNLYVYCWNNPVNLSDESGTWPSWATKVVIGTAVIAVAAVLTVVTAGTGTALACFAVGALKGSVAGAAMGAASGAVSATIENRVKTGSWEGTGKAALNGAASGYMSGAISGFITGGLTSNACFVAGTAVLTSIGIIAIENITIGDMVWSENPETGVKELKKVAQTFINEADELVHVYVNGEEIITTPEHPFYVPKKGWVGAISLRAGDILVLQSGRYVIVELIQHEILESPVAVYNFEVEDFHTYYVGENSVLVHNVCKNVGRSGKQARLREMANDDKLSSALRGEIKRDINAIKRGKRTTIRVPSGYEMAHRLGYSARKGYSYKYADLNIKSVHRLQHRVMGYKY